MSKKISEFSIKKGPSNDAYLPLIDKDNGIWENYKIKITEYFCNKSEINTKFKNLEDKLDDLNSKIENINVDLDGDSVSISSLQTSIELLTTTTNTLSDKVDNLNESLKTKQDKNLGSENSNKVIISNYKGDITASAVSETALNAAVAAAEVDVVGEIKWHAGKSTPKGFLLCDGRAVERSKYSDLFSVIGTTWGKGDGSTTFNLPNLIGRVAWGAKTGSGYIEAGLPNITAKSDAYVCAPDTEEAKRTEGAIKEVKPYVIGGFGWSGEYPYTHIDFDASRCSSIYNNDVTTVQPPAANLMPIIRY